MEKADLKQGLSESKKKIGGNHAFSEIIELKFGKKLPYFLCILTFLRIIVALLSLKNVQLPTFFFLDSSNPG